MAAFLRVSIISIAVFALFISATLNMYFYTTAVATNQKIERQLPYGYSTSRSSSQNPILEYLDYLEVGKTSDYVDTLTSQIVAVRAENNHLRDGINEVRSQLQNPGVVEAVCREVAGSLLPGGISEIVDSIFR